MDEQPDPKTMPLADWLRLRGTRTGTQTINGVTYTNLAEVEWRIANAEWLKPETSATRRNFRAPKS